MRSWVLLLILFCSKCIAEENATWIFPTSDVIANFKDVIILDWTSITPQTILRVWCISGTDGVTEDLASSFFVNSTGPFPYVLATYAPGQTSFPSLCHIELSSDPLGSGINGKGPITWHSNAAEAVKTISNTQAASSSGAATTGAASKSSSSSGSSSATRSSTLSTPTSSTPTSSTPTSSTSGASSASTAAPSSSANASSSSSNTGAIVGGVIGGVALLSFIIIALLFLRRYRRNHASAEPTKRNFWVFNAYKKRGPKEDVTGVFEKEGDGGTHEVDGNSSSRPKAELHGNVDWTQIPTKNRSSADGRGSDAINHQAFELPGH